MMNSKDYIEFIGKTAPRSKHLQTMIVAFVVGGFICCVGQLIMDIIAAINPNMDEEIVGSITSIIMILLGGFFTGIGWYDDLGAIAGAGSIVPITGFANSIVSPAMEFKKEGIIFGISAKMFVIAGPIIVLGVFASFLSGLYAFFVL